MESYESDVGELNDRVREIKAKQKASLEALRTAEKKVARLQNVLNKATEEEKVHISQIACFELEASFAYMACKIFAVSRDS